MALDLDVCENSTRISSIFSVSSRRIAVRSRLLWRFEGLRCAQHTFAVDYRFMADTLISPATQRRTNSALWYGLLITLAGIATQFLYFLRLPQPVPHVLPWINLLLPATGLIYVFIGLARAFSQSAVYAGKIWGSALTGIVLLVVAGNAFLFHKSRAVPNSAGAPQVGQHLPEFTVPDSSGAQTSISQLFAASANGSPPKAVLLVFYRGDW
jgi:hypothetical protein